MSKNERWPENCIWPEPLWEGEGEYWDYDLAMSQELDEYGEELKEIKYYMDRLVEEGVLDDDYCLTEEDFTPEMGEDFWDNGFDVICWESALSDHINRFKLDICDPDPVSIIRGIISYSFINENLLRQAFTRRAFGIEYEVGDSEVLEYYGDTILNTVITQEMFRKFTSLPDSTVEDPYVSMEDEGDLSKIRQHYVNKDYLSERAKTLGLDKFILYGKGEEASGSAREDMMEALIGAVAVDSNWDWRVLEDVVDRLINLQLDDTEGLLCSYYEQLNTWHQKHFGCLPNYVVDRYKDRYNCVLRYSVPENEKDIRTAQMIVKEKAETRSSARELAARDAVHFLMNKGLWMNLKDAGIEPDLENSINQLQELYQKKYVEEAPIYEFKEREKKEWYCSCFCDGFDGHGIAVGKVRAKKKAAFMVLVRMMMSAGLATEEMESAMWKTMERDQ